MNGKALRLENVSHGFGAVEVFNNLSLEIECGEFVAVVGPSGCGKTTLLNLFSGFIKPISGKATISGQMRMVYQQDGLFPWQTVTENISLGLRHIKDQAARAQKLNRMLGLIKLEKFADHYPHQLSGGMRQRAELARALAGSSDILLLDEPFSSLDYLTRLRLRRELARMLDELPRTVVLVTHDIEEAAQLADRVIVLTERPTRISCELRLEAERPRDSTHPEVVDVVRRILAEIGIERQSGEMAGASVGI